MSKLRRNGVVETPQTVGQHLRNQRLMRGLTRAAAGRQMGFDPRVLWHWESEPRDPSVEVWPRILKFLGYYPYPTEGNIAAQVLMLRRIEGVSRTAFGRHLRCNATTVKAWEKAERTPSSKATSILSAILVRDTIPLIEKTNLGMPGSGIG